VPKLKKSRSTSGWAKRVRTRNSWTPRPWNSADHRAESRDHPGEEVDREFQDSQGHAIGCAVTLRGDHMYEFLDRLCNVVLPRVRDFRGLPQNSFDGRGNYTLG